MYYNVVATLKLKSLFMQVAQVFMEMILISLLMSKVKNKAKKFLCSYKKGK